MNPITCADVHFEDGTVQHLEFWQLKKLVEKQVFELSRPEPGWSIYCHWLKGVGEADNGHPQEQWFVIGDGHDEETAKTRAAQWNAQYPQHHYQAFPPAIYPWD